MMYKVVFNSGQVIYADSVSLCCSYTKEHSLLPSSSKVTYPLNGITSISVIPIDNEPSLFNESDYE